MDAAQVPTEEDLRAGCPCLWINPRLAPAADALAAAPVPADIGDAAEARFARCAPALARLFPELAASGGAIASRLVAVPRFAAALLDDSRAQGPLPRVLLKADHELPVAGSIKARGGFHEVLEFAEKLATEHGVLQAGNDSAALANPEARALFSRYRVAVGSTGNLGMSIGMMAAALGFQAVVHMSAEAKAWKKQRLRGAGVTVVEHAGDYEAAVAAGRAEANADAYSHFVDDERSVSLFAGYAAAAKELRAQLAAQQVRVDAHHPLLVYLPCGVGGAPGGIAFGLKRLFGDAVHCFFAEPTAFPCFLVRLAFPERPELSVYDFGLGQATQADGLAVPRASELAADAMRQLLSGVFTVSDSTLLAHLALLHETEGMRIEPSAAAGFGGLRWLLHSDGGQAYLARQGLQARAADATHVLWTTGGSLVPQEQFAQFLELAPALTAAGP
ncbi:D-serine ammonia-lyase [Ramlibacter sp.]|uniref:D-serine ammonia-lyase n=1 Tax=Ramlibacter sp. TaxID=1917967 RepID=UPI00185536AA|nr:D-serine ammonia-lyase [Ramlibacter sp.]MBA2672356.1 D-serine ammonia-lyase [Ramlibacter sp.]